MYNNLFKSLAPLTGTSESRTFNQTLGVCKVMFIAYAKDIAVGIHGLRGATPREKGIDLFSAGAGSCIYKWLSS